MHWELAHGLEKFQFDDYSEPEDDITIRLMRLGVQEDGYKCDEVGDRYY